jgi:hypothetical protein
LRDLFLRTLAAELARRGDGSVGDGDLHRAALAARKAIMPRPRVLQG